MLVVDTRTYLSRSYNVHMMPYQRSMFVQFKLYVHWVIPTVSKMLKLPGTLSEFVQTKIILP